MLQQFVETAGGEAVDLSKASKAGLIHLLRNPALWPAGFEWNFSNCQRCAMGLAHEVWPLEVSHPYGPVVIKALGMGTAMPFYLGQEEGEGSPTADDVARRLELAA